MILNFVDVLLSAQLPNEVQVHFMASFLIVGCHLTLIILNLALVLFLRIESLITISKIIDFIQA